MSEQESHQLAQLAMSILQLRLSGSSIALPEVTPSTPTCA